MSFEERKNGIINGISQVSDEEVLERLEKIRKEEDWFDSLPLEVQKSVIKANKQGDEGLFVNAEIQEEKLRKLL